MTTPLTTPIAPRLVELLVTQEERISRLAKIASHQSTVIADRRTDDLLRVLELRQRLIGEISVAQNAINELAATLNATPDLASPNERVRVRELLDGITLRIEQIMSRDAEDAKSLTEMRNESGKSLREMGQASRVRGAYLRPSTESNQFADTQG